MPKGVSPASLEGKRTGRPKGSKDTKKRMSGNMKWVLDHIDDDPETAKTSSLKAMLKWVQDSPANMNKFMTRVMTSAFDREEEQVDKDTAPPDAVVGLVDELLDIWEEERRKKKMANFTGGR